jgi:hypothetical protein
VHADRAIPNEDPDIIIRDKEKRTCKRVLTDIAISGDRNVIKKEAENIIKYKELKIEIQRMWNVKTNVIPVIIGGNCNHLKIIQKIPEQRTGSMKSRNYRKQPHWTLHT